MSKKSQEKCLDEDFKRITLEGQKDGLEKMAEELVDTTKQKLEQGSPELAETSRKAGLSVVRNLEKTEEKLEKQKQDMQYKGCPVD